MSKNKKDEEINPQEIKQLTSSLSLDQKCELVFRNNYEHVLDYGFYDPIISGSIDGTSKTPHDRALARARTTNYKMRKTFTTTSRPECTLFIGRLNYTTSEEKLKSSFEKYGKIKSCIVVRDVVTGFSRGYAFLEFKHRSDAVSEAKSFNFIHLFLKSHIFKG